jgi:hypothetical protein
MAIVDDAVNRTNGVLELEVVQCRPCRPNVGACMSIETSAASAVQLASQHVCDDARARASRARIIEIAAEARATGFAGRITVHFPPGTFGAHVIDEHGRLIPEPIVRPQRTER